jgi:carotenoid cleavage dioxygenase-like enzyme
LLATVHNLQSQHSELLIVDAQEMVELARVLLPFRTAAQVHGIWADVNELPM